MTDDLENDLDVQVAVKDGAIIVTLPGTSFCVVYRKGADPWLLASDIRDDPNSPISKYTGLNTHLSMVGEKSARTCRQLTLQRVSPYVAMQHLYCGAQ